VVGTNFCDISAHVVENRVVVISAIDNLLKGASGVAVQNMNVMFGFPERLV
ncbi:MAG: N-acetyl-gamma-glutamyl-phosphate reductase, partial [Candidatus Brocadiales bacterium]